MRFQINHLFTVSSVLVWNLPSIVRAGKQNWFTSTGFVEDGSDLLPGAIAPGNNLVSGVNPRLFDLTISLHNSPAGDDDGSTQDTDPGSVDQDNIEKIIQHMADGVYEATEGAHKIRQVRIFRDKSKHDVADIRWDESGHPSAHLNGIGDSGLHIFMYDIFKGGKGGGVDHDLLTDLIGAGYTLTHELGHYAYGLKDEYSLQAGDDPVEPSIMNSQWRARNEASQTLVDTRWLQFSIKNQDPLNPGLYQNTLKTAQHRQYSESCWETLSRDNSITESLSYALTGRAPRVIYPELANVAPNGTDSPSVPDLPGSARSDLDIIWMANATVSEIVIDGSGSMGSNNKISNARTAAKLLVDLSEIGSFIGVFRFTSSAYEVVPLTEIIDQATKDSIKAAIDGIYASGGTSVGRAAQAALDALTATGAPEGNKVVYLLTDGQSGDDSLAPIPAYQAEKIPIFTFSYGADADTVVLGQMATLTKGELYISPVSLGAITQAFQDANAAASGASNVASGSNSVPVGSSQSVPFTIDSSFETMSVTVTYSGASSDLTVSLIDPSTPGTTPMSPSDTTESGGETLVLFSVSGPTPGEWFIQTTENTGFEIEFIWVVSGTQAGVGYTLTSGTSDGVREIEYPDPFILRSSLVKDLPIINAIIEATVTAPDGSSTAIAMNDDGVPPDNVAGDGEYTAAINYDQAGVYEVSVRASGQAGVAMQDGQSLEPAPGVNGDLIQPDPSTPVGEDFERFVRFQIETKNVVSDDHGNTPGTATVLSATNEGTTPGKIETPGDVDVFQIMPQQLTELVVRVSNLAFGMNPMMKVTDSLDVTIIEGSLDTSSSQAGLLSLKFPAIATETYFVHITHQDASGTGYYEISAGGSIPQFDDPVAPTSEPSASPTVAPTSEPSASPTAAPTSEPSASPTVAPTFKVTVASKSGKAAKNAKNGTAPTPEPSPGPTVAPKSDKNNKKN